MDRFPAAIAITLAATTLATAIADQPPSSGKSLTEIVEQLEQRGYGPFLEVAFDDGFWEVEVFLEDAPRELTIDRQSGEVIADYGDDGGVRPPQDAQPLSEILHRLTEAGHTGINEVSFERRYWEVELKVQGDEHELHVDPRTGRIVSDRIDR